MAEPICERNEKPSELRVEDLATISFLFLNLHKTEHSFDFNQFAIQVVTSLCSNEDTNTRL